MRLWPPAWRDEYQVALSKLLAQAPGQLTKMDFSPLSFIAGYGHELSLARDGPHLFVVGPTGSGKSRWLNLLLETISGDPILMLADYKGGATLGRFGPTITDLDSPEDRSSFWRSVLALLEEREQYLARHRSSNANETALRPILLAVDELAHALRLDREALPSLSSVAARGRSLGVHLVCASQSVSGIPRELLVNLSLRVVLSGTDEVDALQLGAKKTPLRNPGGGSALVVGGAEFRFPFRPEPSRAGESSYREP